MSTIFTRLGLPWRGEGEGAQRTFVVDPPSYRFDLEIEEDLIEEVARVYGFERIPAHPPVARARRCAAVRKPGARCMHCARVWLPATTRRC